MRKILFCDNLSGRQTPNVNTLTGCNIYFLNNLANPIGAGISVSKNYVKREFLLNIPINVLKI